MNLLIVRAYNKIKAYRYSKWYDLQLASTEDYYDLGSMEIKVRYQVYRESYIYYNISNKNNGS